MGRKLLKSHPKKFRFLLDSAFAKPENFQKLNRKANIAHAVHNCGLSPQAEDREIYQKAIEENRLVLTINFKDFKKLVKINKVGIVGIDSQLTNEQIDQIVTGFISGKNPSDFKGKATKISNNL